jgi:hypothetical protein
MSTKKPSITHGSLVLAPEYTFIGTLDDMVAKYPWGYSIDLAFLNKTLVRSALFGNKIIFPDGYLMNGPPC